MPQFLVVRAYEGRLPEEGQAVGASVFLFEAGTLEDACRFASESENMTVPQNYFIVEMGQVMEHTCVPTITYESHEVT